MSRALAVSGLVKRFGKKIAIDGLTFEVACGEIVALLGPNGAGKSTTFACLAGLARPDAGTIRFDGRLLESDRGRTVAVIPETPEVYPLLTVWEHLVFVARLCRLDAGWEERGEKLLARFAMLDERDTVGNALSKGMRQKTLIAATVLAGTPVLLLDEPTAHLDAQTEDRVLRAIVERARAGATVVVVGHREQIRAIGDQVVEVTSDTEVLNASV